MTDIYTPSETETVVAETYAEGQFDDTGGTLGDADWDNALAYGSLNE